MGKWVKGQSGNPSGKPPGTSKIAQYRRMIEGKAPDLVETCIRLALSGDTVAMRLCIERLVPAFKAVNPPVILPRAGDGDIEVQAGYILDSLLSGGLAPDLALKILQGLQVHYALTELKDLAARIARLEETKVDDSD